MKKNEIAILAIILLSFAVGISFYHQMPEKMASHWNTQGQVDGYMSKFWVLLIHPLLIAGAGLLLIAIPKIDPLKANIEKFRKNYDRFAIFFLIFIFSFYLQVILWNAGIKINPNTIFPIGFGLLFFYIGILCENTKRNWFIGIKTPWTLSSDKVWEKTHKVAGKLFKIAGIVAFLGVFFQSYALFLILIPVFLLTVYTVIYSYIEYQKEIK